jgi:DNA (cytosine-5)-methyltransferase 1
VVGWGTFGGWQAPKRQTEKESTVPDTNPTPLRALTLFAGAGGADVGLADAGFEHVRCIEYDAHAHATLCAAGFPGVLGDVRDPTLYADLGRIDLMWASPPCQDWSSAGKREGASGERNGWPWTWDAVDLLRRQGNGPTWLVCENVTGMLTHNGAACGSGCCADPERCPATYWHEVVMREARERFAWADYRVLDAADFGTPQFRKRVFLVAGPRPIRWPEPTHGEPTAQRSMFGPALKPWVTVREALNLDGLIEREPKPSPKAGNVPSSTAEPAGCCGTMGMAFIRTEQTGATATPDTMPAPTVPTGGTQYLHSRDPGVRIGYRRGRADGAAMEEHSLDEPACAIRGADGGSTQPFVITRAASEPERLDRPSPAVCCNEVKGSGEGGNPQKLQRASDALFLGTGRRRLTVEECAALFSMPPDYPWQGTMTSKYRQIGNMVAWKVAAALGRAVAEAAT